MNIVLYKDTLYNTKKLYNEVMPNEFLDGFIIGAAMTNDGKIIVYNYASNSNLYIKSIQNENLDELKNNTFVELDEFLNVFKNYKNKIIINLIGQPDLINFPNKNEEFVKKVKNIIEKYLYLNLYICSSYDDVITFTNKYLKNVKKGMVVYRGNLNYYDVDFYIVPNDMFDTKVVAQQLKLNKEIIIVLEESEDIIGIVNKFKDTSYLFDSLNKVEAEKLLYIATKSPKVINIVLNIEKN